MASWLRSLFNPTPEPARLGLSTSEAQLLATVALAWNLCYALPWAIRASHGPQREIWWLWEIRGLRFLVGENQL